MLNRFEEWCKMIEHQFISQKEQNIFLSLKVHQLIFDIIFEEIVINVQIKNRYICMS